MRSMRLAVIAALAWAVDMMSVNKPLISYWLKWMGSREAKVLSLWRLPTGPMFWIPRYCGQDVLTVKLLSDCRMSVVVNKYFAYTAVKFQRQMMSMLLSSPAVRQGSQALIWPIL